MLPVPFFAPGRGNIARGGIGVFAELADTGAGVFPIHLRFSLINRVADFVGIVVGQRGAGVDRPVAVIDAGVFGVEPFLSEIAHPVGNLEGHGAAGEIGETNANLDVGARWRFG